VGVDEIQLTLPADDAFHRVAHLVLGGLASRHDLTVETLEDLTLALDTLLDGYGTHIDDVTLLMRIGEESVRVNVGPFVGIDVRTDVERESGDSLDVHRILAAVVDHVAVHDRDGAQWVELEKRVGQARGEAA
jgi:hypothetical protein